MWFDVIDKTVNWYYDRWLRLAQKEQKEILDYWEKQKKVFLKSKDAKNPEMVRDIEYMERNLKRSMKEGVGKIKKRAKQVKKIGYASVIKQVVDFIRNPSQPSPLPNRVKRQLRVRPKVIGISFDEYNRVLRMYQKATGKTMQEVVNKRAFNIAVRSAQKARVKRSISPTQEVLDKRERTETLADRPDFRRGNEGKTITAKRAMQIARVRKEGLIGENETYDDKKHGLRSRVPRTKAEATKMVNAKIRRNRGKRLGWYKLGFLEAAGILANYTKTKFTRNTKSRGAGTAEPANAGLKAEASITHLAPWAQRAASQSINEAMAVDAADMGQYLKKKLIVDWNGSNTVVQGMRDVAKLARTK